MSLKFTSAYQDGVYYPVYDKEAHQLLSEKQSKLTTEQLSAISSVSGISAIVGSHISNTDIHVTTEDKAYWNEISAISGYGYSAWSAVSSIDFTDYVTSSLNDLATNSANFLYRDDADKVQWSAVDLTSLGKMYDVSSITPSLISAGISADDQGNKFYVVSAVEPTKAQTPDISATTTNLSAWTSAINGKDYYLVSASKNGSTQQYTAGDWIDSNKLQDYTISVSGWSALEALSPLYFSANNDHVVIGIDDFDIPSTDKAAIVLNGFGNGGQQYVGTSAVSASHIATDMNDSYTFDFGKSINIHIDINAKYVVKTDKDYTDSMCTVGFDSATAYLEDGTEVQGPVTNRIAFNMFGIYGSQNYNASTIARIPAGVKQLKFKFITDSDMIDKIEDPCIAVHEI